MFRLDRRLLVYSLVAMLAACSATQEETAGNGDGHSEGRLYALPGLDHGLIQSPVNILTSKSQSKPHEIWFSGGRDQGAAKVSNTGHSVQLDFEPGLTTKFDGKTYDFKQCHFHTPSEHQVDGVTFPMEMHCVHLLPQAAGADGPPQYLVAAFLFKMGSENVFISEFLRQIPKETATADLKKGEPVYVEDLFEELGEKPHYFAYSGSLTTPPYTETVKWLVLDHVFEASPEQIRTINELEGNNARHVQAMHGRSVDSN